MPVVSNTVRDAANNPIPGVKVDIELANIVSGQPGFVTDTDFDIVPPVTLNTDASGLWSADLVGNADIAPAGSIYKVTETVFTRSVKYYYITVPVAGGPYWVGDLITGPPAVVSDASVSGRELAGVDLVGAFTTNSTAFADIVGTQLVVPVGTRPITLQFFANVVSLGQANKDGTYQITDESNNVKSYQNLSVGRASGFLVANVQYRIRPTDYVPGNYTFKVRHRVVDSGNVMTAWEELLGFHSSVFFTATEH